MSPSTTLIPVELDHVLIAVEDLAAAGQEMHSLTASFLSKAAVTQPGAPPTGSRRSASQLAG